MLLSFWEIQAEAEASTPYASNLLIVSMFKHPVYILTIHSYFPFLNKIQNSISKTVLFPKSRYERREFRIEETTDLKLVYINLFISF